MQAALRPCMMPPAMRAVPCVGLPQLAPHLAHGMEDAENRPDAPQFVGEPRPTVPMPHELFEVTALIGRPRPPAGHIVDGLIAVGYIHAHCHRLYRVAWPRALPTPATR